VRNLLYRRPSNFWVGDENRKRLDKAKHFGSLEATTDLHGHPGRAGNIERLAARKFPRNVMEVTFWEPSRHQDVRGWFVSSRSVWPLAQKGICTWRANA
jgi:hypothetical protein